MWPRSSTHLNTPLNPCLPASVPQQLSDNQGSSTLPKPSCKNSRKKNVAEKNHDLNTDFLRRELASATTRITELDATIDDKNKRISILQNKIKLLEERDHEFISNKFNTSMKNNFQNNSSTHNCNNVHPIPQHCCPAPPVYSYCACQNSHRESSPDLQATISNFMSTLQSEFSALRELIEKIGEPVLTSSKTNTYSISYPKCK